MANKNDLFLKLLKQIKFPDKFSDNELLQKGKIENVDVYAKEHKWDIHVLFDTPLKFETYDVLHKLISENFKDFVNTELFVRTEDGSDQYLPDYWHYAVQNSKILKQVAREFLAGQKPTKEDGRWIIPLDNNVIDGLIQQKALDDLAEELRNYGFFNLKFVTKLDQQSSENNLQSLQELQQEHEKSMQEVYDTTPEKPRPQPKQYPTKRRSYGNKQIDKNAPITQIKEIEDGTRNVVIEGNIFSIEARELKSGTVVFTGEITDYSDSIMFKKFTSQKDEIESLSAIKPGTWAKMQGSAADDQWEHDLVFTIYNFETVACTLILYGVLFSMSVEQRNMKVIKNA